MPFLKCKTSTFFTSKETHYFTILLSDGEKSCIGVIGGDALDNRLLVEAAKYLKSKSVNIQTVYASTIDFKAFLLEDDGDDALHDMHAIIAKTDDGITPVQERDCRLFNSVPIAIDFFPLTAGEIRDFNRH